MADLLRISTEIIDNPDVDPGFIPGPTSRINRELSELSTDVAMVEAFSHCIVFRTDDGLVAFSPCTTNPNSSSATSGACTAAGATAILLI